MASVVGEAGSCAAIEDLTAAACGPLIHGWVVISVGRAPEAMTRARPLGIAARSATSRIRSRVRCSLMERWPLPVETEVTRLS